MIRSLYSGVSGLTTHQVRMDVIGNNIANVNSHGYKSKRATFRDIYYQTAISPTSGKVAYAGNNPAEVGYGVQLGSIDKDMSQSSGQGTNSIYDNMIEGDGFFMIETFNGTNIASDTSARQILFTRLGNFQVDSYGNLVSAVNSFVIGSRNSLAGLKSVGNISEDRMGEVSIKDRNGDNTINSSDIEFRNTLNLNELVQTAYGVFKDENGYMYNYDWDALIGGDAGALTATDSPVVYDYDGDPAAFPTTIAERMKYVDVQQTLINLNTITAGDADNAGAPLGLEYRYYVDKTGKAITDTAGARIAYAANYNAIRNAQAAYDAAATDADKATTKAALDTAKGVLNSLGGIQGELKYSDMTSVNIGADGMISVQYNGDLKYIARLEVAMFDNPFGLDEAGNTSFSVSSASGDAHIRKPGQDGAGEIKSKYLEMSNVNLANEFSDMIVTQRGYQANARMITTSDSMLEELVNLKR
ncbi:MAG: flagellar hook-basal body complex protein [Oscillospiraceae bacterium]|nr:flagellar hook-basal body complex protein [Oscillospiraceae bacterium]